jgi:GNAT superfamily N-acetyltransferase
MEHKLKIRKAVPDDAISLKKCMETAYATYQERMGGERLPPMNVDYSAEIRNYPCWVIEAGGSILGGLIMVFEKEASIANVAVNPQHHGQGVGGKLMKFADLIAKEKNYSELRLATHVLLSENISLYQHLGWKETGRDETRVFMKKAL